MAHLTFYGGVNEIGGNKVLLEDGDSRIFLDFGKSFNKWGRYYEEFLTPRSKNELRDLLYVGVVPPLDGIYRQDLLKAPDIESVIQNLPRDPDQTLWSRGVASYQQHLEEKGKPFLDGVLISHGHEDHFKHIAFLDPHIKIYCSPITTLLLQVAEELGLGGPENEITSAELLELDYYRSKSATFPGEPTLRSRPVPRAIQVLAEGMVGAFHVKGLPVDHSVPGASAYYVTTPSGQKLFYSGDLRFHGTRVAITEAFRNFVSNLRPDILIVEGTRIHESEPDSEVLVRDQCIQVVKETRGLAMAGFAWKDTTRFKTMKEVANSTGRTLVVSPKLAYLLNRLKGTEGLDTAEASLDDARVYLPRENSMLYSKGDYTHSKYKAGYSVKWDGGPDLEHFNNGVRAYDIRKEPHKYLVHLPYYDFNELVDLAPPPGSTFIAAYSEPFDPEMELEERRIKNWLQRFEINSPSFEPRYIHASGHASGPEIKELISLMQPKRVIPVHTEKPSLFAQGLPKGIQVLEPTEGQSYTI